mmetsp:Transcript_12427/g.14270  ORF Transcript_12427/g.14270 Transcript_12427/m.14270 type:complete len:219 (-) Transcript_12427:802-1458(-)
MEQGLFTLAMLPFLAIISGFYVYLQSENTVPVFDKPITVITESPRIEELLTPYKDLLGTDYEGYRGHLYRVLTYSLHFLDGDETYRDVIESALVYHDIGLWTDGQLSYLEPSVARAKESLSGYGSEELQLVEDIIMQHHKFSPFTGANEKVVNAVRKADWIDASMGIFKKGIPKNSISKVQAEVPNAGFHNTLMEFGPRLHGYNVPKMIYEISGIFRV